MAGREKRKKEGNRRTSPQFCPFFSCLRFLNSADPTISEPGTGYLLSSLKWPTSPPPNLLSLPPSPPPFPLPTSWLGFIQAGGKQSKICDWDCCANKQRKQSQSNKKVVLSKLDCVFSIKRHWQCSSLFAWENRNLELFRVSFATQWEIKHDDNLSQHWLTDWLQFLSPSAIETINVNILIKWAPGKSFVYVNVGKQKCEGLSRSPGYWRVYWTDHWS